MKYKDGVYTSVTVVINGKETKVTLSVQLRSAMLAAEALHKEITGVEMTITAVLDGKHMEGSKHYSGNAFDMRSWFLKGIKLKEFCNSLKVSLGNDYDVVVESTHIHIEYDPKN